MAKQLCLIHANCQGDALKELLEASPGFGSRFEIRHLRNYEKQALEQGLLDETAIFLHQHLTEKWGEISTAQVLCRLPATAQAICIPNCFFKGYWPFWENKPEVIEFYDSLLERLLARGLELPALLHLYQKADPALTGDLERVAQDSLMREREKEAFTPIKYVNLIEERWREEQLFLTINHPAPRLLIQIAQQILQLLGVAQIPDSFCRDYVSPHNEFWLPIHPAAGKRLQLPFADKTRRYPCFGSNLTHTEYTRIYLACRQYNFTDLPSALASHARTLQNPEKESYKLASAAPQAQPTGFRPDVRVVR